MFQNPLLDLAQSPSYVYREPTSCTYKEPFLHTGIPLSYKSTIPNIHTTTFYIHRKLPSASNTKPLSTCMHGRFLYSQAPSNIYKDPG